MTRRPCLNCGALVPSPAGRCTTCQATYDAQVNRARGSASFRGYDSAYRKVAAEVVAQHRRLYGDLCPGYQIPPHRARALTVDHVVPKSQGGTDDRGNLRVLCRACNSRKGDR